MTALRSLLFNIAFFGWSALMLVICLPVLLTPKPVVDRASRFWARSVLWMARIILGLDYRIAGREHLPEEPFLVAAKHQSAWDTLVFLPELPTTSYVLKRELTWIPIYGWFLKRYGVVAIDRKAGAKALRALLREARSYIDQGRPLLIFPEGTRTAPEENRPYQPGLTALYKELKVPVVPVALNSGVFWPRRSFLKRSGCITLEFLPPIEPGLDRRSFTTRLHAALDPATERLAEDGRAQIQGNVPNAATKHERSDRTT